jgi:uncharacterized membrane protein
MPRPILQSFAINALSLAVGFGIDVRNRLSYMRVRASACGCARSVFARVCVCIGLVVLAALGVYEATLAT